MKSHWTIEYAINRLRKALFDFTHKDSPWLTQQSIKYLEFNLRRNWIGCEWGSGRSTLWFGKKVRKIYSIEHDEHWFNQIHKLINKNLLGNVDIQHKPLGEGFDQEYIEGFRNMSESPDFILIDGRKRDLCALEAVNIVKDGGLVIIDNINRYIPNSSQAPESANLSTGYQSNEWEYFDAITANWDRIWTSDGVTDTVIYTKPTD